MLIDLRYRLVILVSLLFPMLAASGAVATERVALRVTLGFKDKEPTPWRGEFVLDQGKVVGFQSIRRGRWKKPNAWQGQSAREATRGMRKRKVPKDKWPVKPLSFIAVLEIAPRATVGLKTAQGEFSVNLAELPVGTSQRALKGKALVERIVHAEQLTTTPTQDDFPSVCETPDGTIWVAFTSYTEGIPPSEWQGRFKEEPRDFTFLAKEPGGDQLHLMAISDGAVREPTPITQGGLDLYGTAMAVDGKGKPWVVWSANVQGNWELFASGFDGKGWAKPMRLTQDPGSDFHPVMTTTKAGILWLAWQAFRGNNSDILAKSLRNGRWSDEIVVGRTPANEWAPAIAASITNDVCVAWDTYAKGDYDVYYATISPEGEVGDAKPAAASLLFEAQPSVLYDEQGRLWIAWEEAPARWGKDSGTTDTGYGQKLYGGARWPRVRCFINGRPHRTRASLKDALDPPQKQKAKPKRKRGQTMYRANNGVTLSTDAEGRVWLVFKHRDANRGRQGGQWTNYATCFDGQSWSRAALLMSSDSLMGKRPALVRRRDGAIAAVYNSDARQRKGSPINDDIWMATLSTLGEVAPAELEAEDPIEVATPEPPSLSEIEDVARIRDYRATVAGKTYRILRGEFHRHTEISGDGANDGTFLDMWRYGIDVTAMDWFGNGDHDNGGGREYSWWYTQKLTDVFNVQPTFVTMFTYERSVRYPDGHRNAMFAQRGVRTLPRLAGNQPNGVARGDTQMFYKYLRKFGGICSSHTSATDMGTDWRDNDPEVEPVIEIFQGCRQSYEYPGAPKSGNEKNSKGGYKPAGFWWNALAKGYLLGTQSSSDHGGTHISYGMVFVEEQTREAVLDAFKRRHSYGATDNIVLDVRMGDQMMGDLFKSTKPARLEVKAIGTCPIAQIDIIKNKQVVYTTQPKKQEVSFVWQDSESKPGRSYYYVRVIQENEELAWASPMWIDRP